MPEKERCYETVHEIWVGPDGYKIRCDGVVVAEGIADIEAARAEVDRRLERWDPTGRSSGRDTRRSLMLP